MKHVALHCSILLTDGNGTITIHQKCNFATPTPQGRWEIVVQALMLTLKRTTTYDAWQ